MRSYLPEGSASTDASYALFAVLVHSGNMCNIYNIICNNINIIFTYITYYILFIYAIFFTAWRSHFFLLLFALLMHPLGGASGGHYYCYVKPYGVHGNDQQHWLKFNDSTVTFASEAEVQSTYVCLVSLASLECARDFVPFCQSTDQQQLFN